MASRYLLRTANSERRRRLILDRRRSTSCLHKNSVINQRQNPILQFALRRVPAALLVCALIACTRTGGGSAGRGLHSWTLPDTVRIGMFEEPLTLNPVLSTITFEDD